MNVTGTERGEAVLVGDVAMTEQPMRNAASFPTSRLLFWQVKRELWENRSVWIAPAATTVLLLGLWIFGLIEVLRKDSAALVQGGPLTATWVGSATLLLAVGCLVGIFYSLDALYGERRERSVLFWKSMPVSNSVTVLAKLAVPMLVVPAVSFVTAVALQVLTFAIAVVVLLLSHVSLMGAVHAGFGQAIVLAAYWVVVVTLWYAPIYAFLLLVSAVAPRQPFLLTTVPLLVLMGVEFVVLHTTRLATFVGHCFTEVFTLAKDTSSSGYQGEGVGRLLGVLTPREFFASPHLWVGLVVAGLFVWLAVQRRRAMSSL